MLIILRCTKFIVKNDKDTAETINMMVSYSFMALAGNSTGSTDKCLPCINISKIIYYRYYYYYLSTTQLSI